MPELQKSKQTYQAFILCHWSNLIHNIKVACKLGSFTIFLSLYAHTYLLENIHQPKLDSKLLFIFLVLIITFKINCPFRSTRGIYQHLLLPTMLIQPIKLRAQVFVTPSMWVQTFNPTCETCHLNLPQILSKEILQDANVLKGHVRFIKLSLYRFFLLGQLKLMFRKCSFINIYDGRFMARFTCVICRYENEQNVWLMYFHLI